MGRGGVEWGGMGGNRGETGRSGSAHSPPAIRRPAMLVNAFKFRHYLPNPIHVHEKKVRMLVGKSECSWNGRARTRRDRISGVATGRHGETHRHCRHCFSLAPTSAPSESPSAATCAPCQLSSGAGCGRPVPDVVCSRSGRPSVLRASPAPPDARPIIMCLCGPGAADGPEIPSFGPVPGGRTPALELGGVRNGVSFSDAGTNHAALTLMEAELMLVVSTPERWPFTPHG